MEPPDSRGASSFIDPFDWDLKKIEARIYCEDVAARLTEMNVPTEYMLLEGRPEDCIIRVAQSYDQALLMLSSHGQGGIGDRRIGSVVQKIMLRRHISTMIVRANVALGSDWHSWRYHRLLVPLDGSQRAECVLPLATVLAHFHEAHIILAHVVSRPEMPRGMLTPCEDLELANQLTEHRRAEAIRYLQRIRSQLGVDVETRLLVSDSPTVALHDLIEQEQVDLMVMSAHGYSAKAEWPCGSLAINFITYGTTPLLIVQDLPEKAPSVQEEITPRGVQATLRQGGWLG
jgi:nucleotide-binding universal stress UspA family protein